MNATPDQNKALIRQFFDAWNNRRPDAFDGLIAPDVVRHCDAMPGMEAKSLDVYLPLDSFGFRPPMW
jgi:ketosteroid isomerase-like protein